MFVCSLTSLVNVCGFTWPLLAKSLISDSDLMRRRNVCVASWLRDGQWLMFISLSSSSSAAEKAENLTGSQPKVRRLTRQAVCVLLKSGTVTRRTSCPQGPVGRKE